MKIEKVQKFNDYTTVMNTLNLINIQKMTLRVSKMVEECSKDTRLAVNNDDIKSLSILHTLYDPKTAIYPHMVLMSIDGGVYRSEHEYLEQLSKDCEVVEDFALHLLEKSGNDIESFKKSELGKEDLNQNESLLIEQYSENFNKEMERNANPRLVNCGEIFDAMDEGYETAKRGSVPTCEEIKLFHMFNDLYYETWSKAEDNNVPHKAAFIGSLNLK